MHRVFETEVAGRPLIIESGKMALLAKSAVLVRYGETVVSVAVAVSEKPRDGVDFFPLSIDYEEKLYSVGKIPGGFIKREGRPSEKAILTSRVIDRPLRPLFPKGLRNDVSITATVLAVDNDNPPEFAAMIGSSAALSISDLPFAGPVGSVIVGLIDGKFVINPNEEERAKSTLHLTVSSSRDKVCMIEAGGDEIPEDVMIKAIEFGHEENQKIIKFIDSIAAEIGQPKKDYNIHEVPEEIYNDVKSYGYDKIKEALITDSKLDRHDDMKAVTEDIQAHFAEKYPDLEADIADGIYHIEKEIVRHMLLRDKQRVDGRGMDEIRPLSAEVGVIPRVHGSSLFSRGQTQVLNILTLGPLADVQTLDGLDEVDKKRYMHHYNFPGYSTGEAKPSRGPGRREIGHGALAERSLVPVIPSEDEFPYAIRLVSEVMSSNGSTSQASVCSSTLSLMDAGVPIKKPVAGISVGLVTASDDVNDFVTMVDIQGIEDFFGDMDFKVAGTHDGITAIQMDMKIHGLTMEIVKEAFAKTKKARDYIIDEIILKAIDKPRESVSKYAPKIQAISINPDKIRDVIGPGGKVINKIIAETGVKIDIQEDGRVFIYSEDIEMANKARKRVEDLTAEVIVGNIYVGKVTKTTTFGAFAEVLPGKEGLIHISQLSAKRVNKVEDVVNVGDEVLVKVTGIDDMGRVNLSRKDAVQTEE